MQINGAQLGTLFSSKSPSLQENNRAPVTIDGDAYTELLPTSSIKSVVTRQAPITVNEQQQARFVRFFSVSEPSSAASNPYSLQVATPSLPKGVQQYLQVAATFNTGAQQGLLNEIV